MLNLKKYSMTAFVTKASKTIAALPTKGFSVKSPATPRAKGSSATTSRKFFKADTTTTTTATEKSINKMAEDNIEQAKYLAKHKYFIMSPGRQLGLSIPQLLKHDLSKLTPSEWGPYKRYWFGDRTPQDRKDFDVAREHHYQNNPHHYRQRSDISKNKVFKYQLEEVADWYAAAKAQSSNSSNFPSFANWYETNRQHFITHQDKPVESHVDSFIRKKIR